MGLGRGWGGTNSTAQILTSLAPAGSTVANMALVPIVEAMGSTFDGVVVGQANTVAVKYTFKGDSNLTGSVTAADYALLDNHFGQTDAGKNDIAAAYAVGDWNLDGKVTAADYALLDNNFGKGVGGAGPLAVAVPEAGSLLIGVAGLGLGLLRRRGKGKRWK